MPKLRDLLSFFVLLVKNIPGFPRWGLCLARSMSQEAEIHRNDVAVAAAAAEVAFEIGIVDVEVACRLLNMAVDMMLGHAVPAGRASTFAYCSDLKDPIGVWAHREKCFVPLIHSFHDCDH